MRYIIVLRCRSSSSYLRNSASQGVQEENSREGSALELRAALEERVRRL